MIIPIISTILYFFVSILFGINGINPSDPLEYIIPIYNEIYPFPYLDRIVLAPILKLISLISISPQSLSWLAPVIINIGTFFVSSLYIYKKRKNIESVALFTVLTIASPFNISTFSYLYPTGILTFMLVIGAILLTEQDKLSNIKAGIITPFIVFSKAQGLSFPIQVFYKTYRERTSSNELIRSLLKYTIITIFSTIILYILICIIFGDLLFVYKTINFYIQNNLEGQYNGYGGSMPPFIMYLFEPYVLLLIIFCLKFKEKKSDIYIEFLISGILQIFILVSVYYITKRGGALIPNYISPAMYLITIYVALITPLNINKKLNNILIYSTLVILILVYIYFHKNGTQYFATNNSFMEYIAVVIMILLTIIKIKSNYLITILMCITLLFSYKAQNENIARNEWSKPYEFLFEMSDKVGSRVSVDIKLDESKDLSDRRLNELSKISNNKYGICLLGVDCQEDYIITNRSETLAKNSIPLQEEYGFSCRVNKEGVSNEDKRCQDLVKGKFSKIDVISGMNEFSVVNKGLEVANVYIAADENNNNSLIVWDISKINSECNPLVYSFEYENDFSQGAREKISQSTSLIFRKKLGIYVEGLSAKCELKINIDKKIIKPREMYGVGYTNLILIKNLNKK